MMAGVFVLFQIVMVLIACKKRNAAVILSLVTIVFAWMLFIHHVELPLDIRL